MKANNTRSFYLSLLVFFSGFSTPLYAADIASTPDDAIVTSGSGDALFAGVSGKQLTAPKTDGEFEAFNATYNHQWKSAINSKTGKVKMLHGFVSKTYGDNPEVVARSFLKDAHTLFGVKSDLSDLKLQRVDKTTERNHTRFQQLIAGVPVEGAEVVVHSNQAGQVTMVQNGYAQDIALANRDIISESIATQSVRSDLTTVVGASDLSVSKAEKRIIRVRGEYRVVWRIVTSTLQPRGYWVYKIDAESGAIIYKANEITSLKSGKGRAFINNAAWFQNIPANVTLPNMYTTADGYQQGWLWGPHINIYVNNANDPYSFALSFIYDPVTQKDAFDAVHAYYQLNTAWIWWDKKVLAKNSLTMPSYFYTDSIPTFVNVIGMCNAFYSPDIDGNLNPGFAFGDEDSCSAGSEDLVIDNDVVRHEFAHAVMDWSGAGFQEQYGGPVDHYGRAMGEGNADWYAYVFSKDPYMGEVAFYPGYLRTLDSTRMYPADVDEPTLTVPEEHYTGEIWGGYLYDVYRALKTKAIPYIYKSSYYFSATGGFVDGIPDFQDAIQAQAAAEYDLTGKQTSTAKVWGAMASRGINATLRAPYSHASDYFGSGIAGADDDSYLYFSFPAVKSIKTSGNMLTSGDVHEYIIQTTVSGMTLTATATGSTTGLTAPTVALYDISGTPITSVGPSLTTSALLTYSNLPAGDYVITVTGNATSPGHGLYKFAVATK